MTAPLVTVGIPIYNHEKYVVKCLESIVNQSYSNIEIIAIDDGSPDNSYQIAKDYLESQTINPNFSIITRPNIGLCGTLNEIAKKAKGKYITLGASDDYWALDKVADQAEFLEKNPDIALVHSNAMKVDANENEMKVIDYSGKENSGNLFKALIFKTGGINSPSNMYRTSIYDEIGYYDPGYKIDDTDYWLRLTKNNLVGFINKVHVYYRWHGENISNSSNNAFKFYYDETIAIYKKNIDDPQLLHYAVGRLYKKAIGRALKVFEFKIALKYAMKLINLKKEIASTLKV